MIMDGKVFSDEIVDIIVDMITDGVKPKVPAIFRPLVRPAVKIAVNVVNKKMDGFVPDEIDFKLNKAVKRVKEGDWDDCSVLLAEATNMLVDIPKVDEDKEQELFTSIALVVVNAIKNWAND